jgi:hypothetical protein
MFSFISIINNENGALFVVIEAPLYRTQKSIYVNGVFSSVLIILDRIFQTSRMSSKLQQNTGA